MKIYDLTMCFSSYDWNVKIKIMQIQDGANNKSCNNCNIIKP